MAWLTFGVISLKFYPVIYKVVWIPRHLLEIHWLMAGSRWDYVSLTSLKFYQMIYKVVWLSRELYKIQRLMAGLGGLAYVSDFCKFQGQV